tara:strand:+ start:564 stop:2192 length:1629 start_codon:yes stop_codon:yes gene_type:complete
MKKYFIADFYADKINGGGELVNQIIIDYLRDQGYDVVCYESKDIDHNILKKIDKDFIIIGNFLQLKSLEILNYITNNCNYAIIEHDHKYLKTRNPSVFKNYIAPENQIIHCDFYRNARAIFCQSTLHSKIISENLNINNVVNLQYSLWTDENLDYLQSLQDQNKNKEAIIVNSNNPVKGVDQSKSFCASKNIEYNIVGPVSWNDLMLQMSQHKKLVFFSQVLETFCRLIVEAKMLGCQIITNRNNACTQEDWFAKYSGLELIQFLREKKKTVFDKIEKVINRINGDFFIHKNKANIKDITVILNSYRRPYNLNMQAKAIQNQTILPKQTWLWTNDHKDNRNYDYSSLGFDRIFNNDYNWKFYGRFAAALLADTEYIAIFDDDTVPGTKWFENCLNTMKTHEGILGSAGIILNDKNYVKHDRCGWPTHNKETTRVDLVGHAWFFKREWLQYLWKEKPPTWDNGEDIQFAYSAQKYGGIQTYCPPHPANDLQMHGSIMGNELGIDDKATSTNSNISHKQFFEERDLCVLHGLENGWKTTRSVEL